MDRHDIKNLKNCFPFRFGTTSYIIPAGIEENVAILADKVDDIELVLFESDEISNLPNRGVLDKLISLKERHDLSFTVHLPTDIAIASKDKKVRKDSVGKCIRVIELMREINPFGYILHCTSRKNLLRGESATAVSAGVESIRKSLREFASADINPEIISVETLDYPFKIIGDIVSEEGFSICLDIGHIILGGYPLDEYLNRYLEKTRIIHLHGIVDKKDHRSVRYLDDRLLGKLIGLLKENTRRRVVTIEVFNEDDFYSSVEKMKEYI